MDDQVYFEDVTVGAEIPPLCLAVSRVQMFFFSAATYNGHRIHYDVTWARDVEGYPDILVHGPLQVASLARALTDWASGGGRLIRYAVQNRGTAHPDEELQFRGLVTALRPDGDRGLVELEIRGEKGGTVLMPGTATVSLPRRGKAGE
ncbi:MAG: acyl dehydratase [Propionibacteriales bacterium]|nr:acyl dehydratase [Propionibacteriales bacterium]